ncbi:helix-turn-helix domain-containing protein [Roseibium sp.]|uniref:helix-turn-helix domain-containing protein n=1 Tax=Roseibium sp. TaxID=1936156 RepID=UPI003B50349E
MSHKATNWAILQRGLKPAAKIVLWHLCDRHNPDHGCFPKQETLARDCEMSRSTLNLHLKDLERRGLIRREQRRNPKTFQQEATRYKLGFEADFVALAAERPCPDSGQGTKTDPVSGSACSPRPDLGPSRVRVPDTNPVREPVKNPLSDRARGDAGRSADGGVDGGTDEGVDAEPALGPDDVPGAEKTPDTAPDGGSDAADDPKQIERQFWKLVRDWPGLDGMPKQRALRAFQALSAADRAAALARRDAWFALLRATGRSFTPAPSTYCTERLWQDVPDPDTGSRGSGSAGRGSGGAATGLVKGSLAGARAAPFGKAWSAVRFADLMRPPYGRFPKPSAYLQGVLSAGGAMAEGERLRRRAVYGWPKVSALQARALRQRKGCAADPALAPLEALFGAVRVGSELWEAWKGLHAARGWPWFGADRDLPDWIYLPEPPEGFDRYPDLPAAVAAALARFEAQHKVLDRAQDQGVGEGQDRGLDGPQDSVIKGEAAE